MCFPGSSPGQLLVGVGRGSRCGWSPAQVQGGNSLPSNPSDTSRNADQGSFLAFICPQVTKSQHHSHTDIHCVMCTCLGYTDVLRSRPSGHRESQVPPAEGTDALHRRQAGSSPWETYSLWCRVGCLSSLEVGAGEGFLQLVWKGYGRCVRDPVRVC